MTFSTGTSACRKPRVLKTTSEAKQHSTTYVIPGNGNNGSVARSSIAHTTQPERDHCPEIDDAKAVQWIVVTRRRDRLLIMRCLLTRGTSGASKRARRQQAMVTPPSLVDASVGSLRTFAFAFGVGVSGGPYPARPRKRPFTISLAIAN
jgi:hypothetical protein